MIVQKRKRRDASAFGAMINIQFLLACSWERQDNKSRGPALKTADEEQQEEEEIWQSSKCAMSFFFVHLNCLSSVA